MNAKPQQKFMNACWSDLENAFGSVDYHLIYPALQHYHATEQFKHLMMRNFYYNIFCVRIQQRGSRGTVVTKK